VTQPDKVSGPPEGGWESLKVDELKAELEARGLPKSGTKAELIARLEESGGADEAAVSEAAGRPAAEDSVSEAAEEEVVEAEAPTEPEAEEADEADEDEEADENEEADEDEEPTAPARRRGSAETAAPQQRRAPARRDEDGAVLVLARAKYVRSAPRKARLVMDHIRGKRVEQAQAILQHAPRAVSTDILKLLNSAVANAESAYELGADELRVKRAFVDEGPTIKRFRPRALGRATRINKRTSHMTIELTTEGNGR
jgi:large subunit ribosomal protein L22